MMESATDGPYIPYEAGTAAYARYRDNLADEYTENMRDVYPALRSALARREDTRDDPDEYAQEAAFWAWRMADRIADHELEVPQITGLLIRIGSRRAHNRKARAPRTTTLDNDLPVPSAPFIIAGKGYGPLDRYNDLVERMVLALAEGSGHAPSARCDKALAYLGARVERTLLSPDGAARLAALALLADRPWPGLHILRARDRLSLQTAASTLLGTELDSPYGLYNDLAQKLQISRRTAEHTIARVRSLVDGLVTGAPSQEEKEEARKTCHS